MHAFALNCTMYLAHLLVCLESFSLLDILGLLGAKTWWYIVAFVVDGTNKNSGLPLAWESSPFCMLTCSCQCTLMYMECSLLPFTCLFGPQAALPGAMLALKCLISGIWDRDHRSLKYTCNITDIHIHI